MTASPPPWLVEADDDSYAAAVSGPLPVLVELWAPWCEPCGLDRRAVQSAASVFAGRLKVVQVNVDDAPEVAQVLDARVVPMQLVIHHGREIARQFGLLSGEELTGWLGGVLPKAA
jgi:thioredoxin 2